MLKIVLYLNKINLAHWDIRPHNIWVNPTTLDLKIVNFSNSNYLNETSFTRYKIQEPVYSAPELIKGEFGFEWDIWSIGVIAYELLSGKLPFGHKFSK